MRTDWALVRRLAFELDDRLRGARVQDAGVLADGRPAIELWSRGDRIALALDLFDSPPVVTLEPHELAVDEPAGFSRTLSRTLRGMSVGAISAGLHERLVVVNFRTRSRFGVGDEIDLYIELVPRFGNAVLVKTGTIVAACKIFDPAQSARPTTPGLRYEPPPPTPAVLLPRLVEESGAQADAALAALDSQAVLREPLYVYRVDGALLQAHLLPLPQLASVARESREPSLLDVLAEDRIARKGGATAARTGQRRDALDRRIATRARRIENAMVALRAREEEIAGREALRREGEAIYATLHELPPDEQLEAKKRAVKLFARYRKLSAGMTHLAARRSALLRQRQTLETLSWEASRASDEDLADVERAFSTLEGRQPREERTPRRKTASRVPLEFRTPNGSRILVGRSPSENAELTFRVARPNDLWFHARGTPGAHVILARDDRSEPPDEDVALAASLAAGHSKAQKSAKVTVDYTTRKHVRKQPDAPPGLVFYTNARSVTVAPRRD